MTPERWRMVKALFAAAEELPAEKRGSFLDKACADDPELRVEADRLLQWRAQADTFLDDPPHRVLGPLFAARDFPIRSDEIDDLFVTGMYASEPVRETPLINMDTEVANGPFERPPALAPGDRMARYEILSRLAVGGMGEVYLARDPGLDRNVAVKVLPLAFAADKERVRRLYREGRAASALNHPNILTVYEIGESRGRTFLATEFVEGVTLRARLRNGCLSPDEAVHIASQVGSALVASHNAGILHRDIKPENLMLRPDGYLKVLDFGLAKMLDRPEKVSKSTTRTVETEPGRIAGSIYYMSPEQVSGRELDPRTDLWSLGVVLYEMLIGTKPFCGDTLNHVAVAILDNPIPELPAHVPTNLGAVIRKALAKERETRYRSAEELLIDVKLRVHSLEGSNASTGRMAESIQRTIVSHAVALPAARTSFIGREQELQAVKQRLLAASVRLVTLTGAGGSGKTRLALQAAAELLSHFPGGVHFISLSAVTDPSVVASMIARCFGLNDIGGSSVSEALREHLRLSVHGAALLLLDNFEHLLQASPIVIDLLEGCAFLKVLVTSRTVLHVYGEHEYPVPPLVVPDHKRLPAFEVLSENPAVALFVDRASAVKFDFTLTTENAPAVAEVCSRVDGLPLAIELVAARVKVLPPAAMLARLQTRLEFVTGGTRDLPARQQTLRRTIDWSHELLSAAEQILFRRLCVFAGGFTLESAEAVCNAHRNLEIDVVDGMNLLLDHSLIQQTESRNGEVRFRMLETIREYALERLKSTGEEEETRQAHAAYCLVLAEEGDTKVRSPERAEWLTLCEAEHDNLRAALKWLLERQNAEWALRFGLALFNFWEGKEYLAEGSESLLAILKLPASAARTRKRAKVLEYAGCMVGFQGDFQTASVLKQEALDIFHELGNKKDIMSQLNALGSTEMLQENWVAARSLYEQSLRACRELGSRSDTAAALSNLARVVNAQADHELARSFLEEALSMFRELGDSTSVGWTYNYLGDVAQSRGDLAEASRLYLEGADIFQSCGDRWGLARSFTDLGYLACDQNNQMAGHSHFDNALRLFLDLGHKRGVAKALEGLTCLAISQNDLKRAFTLAGAAAALRQTMGATSRPGEQAKFKRAFEPAWRSHDPDTAKALWTSGWVMPLEQTINYALRSMESKRS